MAPASRIQSSPTQMQVAISLCWLFSEYRLPRRPASAIDCDDRKVRDDNPDEDLDGDGNPSRWRFFETAVKWFPRTLKKKQERNLVANHIIGRMLRSRVVAIRLFATTLDPDRYETYDGHLLLLEDLLASPLGNSADI